MVIYTDLLVRSLFYFHRKTKVYNKETVTLFLKDFLKIDQVHYILLIFISIASNIDLYFIPLIPC